LFVLFIGLGVTADSFFCPSLRVIADKMRLSQNIAGVTFLAFGNGAPDVFSAIAAITNAKNGDAGLAFGALLGAGIFVSTVVAGTICIIKPFTSNERPLLRDLIFFMVASFWTFTVIWDGYIALWETVGW
jgi:solute carrier family 24 (sodium/potassium/calcium exchanger), member 6